MKIVIASVLSIALLTACTDSGNEIKKGGEVFSSIADGENTDAELAQKIKKIAAEESARELSEKKNVTSMTFDRLAHDFGDVKSETDNGTVFVVTNTGNKPLIIDDVKASCGCTTPKKPEGPILPGKSDEITVNFKPNAEQKGEITKTITVSANTDPRLTTLSIRAFVK